MKKTSFLENSLEHKKELFNNRNKLKQHLNIFGKNKYPKKGEVWYVSLGQNIGCEEDGKGKDYKRPVLVIKKLGNMYFCIPMTTKGKNNNIYYYEIDYNYFQKKSFIIKSQPRVCDRNRFIEKMGKIKNKEFLQIKKKLKEFWF